MNGRSVFLWMGPQAGMTLGALGLVFIYDTKDDSDHCACEIKGLGIGQYTVIVVPMARDLTTQFSFSYLRVTSGPRL